MKSRKKIFLYFLFLPTIPMSCPAQFNTIQKQPQVVKSKPISDVLSDSESDSLLYASNRQSESLEFFDLPNHREIAIEYDIPLFVSVKDCMMMELLNRRTSVALPLDFIHVTSDYGYRRDPITRVKERFHNGIDLRCAKGSLVYAMMPGVIEKVVYSETGYGHHVIINHVGLRILYGHLGIIAVKEGDVVSPGTIVALSSDTGRSTGPHLHIRAERLVNGEWKSVDPEPFIKHLNDYIYSLQEEMANLRFEVTMIVLLFEEALTGIAFTRHLDSPSAHRATTLQVAGRKGKLYFSVFNDKLTREGLTILVTHLKLAGLTGFKEFLHVILGNQCSVILSEHHELTVVPCPVRVLT